MKIKFNTLALSAVVATTLVAAPVQAEKKALLKLPVWFGTHLTGLGSTPKWLAENVNAASDGSLKIKIYEPGNLIPPKEMLDSISKGQINAGYTTPGYNTGKGGNKAVLEENLWLFNYQTIDLLANGIPRDRDITYLEITDKHGERQIEKKLIRRVEPLARGGDRRSEKYRDSV